MMYFSKVAFERGKVVPSQATGGTATGPWTNIEHKRFLAAIERYPQGPWKAIARFVGTRTPRQAQTHAQKYREKIFRQARGLKRVQKKSPPPKVEETTIMTVDETLDFFADLVLEGEENWPAIECEPVDL